MNIPNSSWPPSSVNTRIYTGISYVFEDEYGMIDIPNEMAYYREHCFQMQYKDTIGEPFDWLYIDVDTLKEHAAKNGYAVEIVAGGEHYEYLARIMKK